MVLHGVQQLTVLTYQREDSLFLEREIVGDAFFHTSLVFITSQTKTVNNDAEIKTQ